jgi:hypothetical protein
MNLLTTWQRAYTRALCQKNEGSVEVKQRSIKMGGSTILKDIVT